MLKSILKDEHGVGYLIVFLCILPLLVVGAFWMSNITKTVYEYDAQLHIGASEAVRNAAFMVQKDSMAVGKPILNHERSYDAFLEILRNRLTDAEIQRYSFVVFNYGYGDNSTAYFFVKEEDGSINNFNVEDLSGTEQEFFVSPSGISLINTDGSSKVTFKESGCIGMVEIKTEGLINNDKDSGLRWAASTIIVENEPY